MATLDIRMIEEDITRIQWVNQIMLKKIKEAVGFAISTVA